MVSQSKFSTVFTQIILRIIVDHGFYFQSYFVGLTNCRNYFFIDRANNFWDIYYDVTDKCLWMPSALNKKLIYFHFLKQIRLLEISSWTDMKKGLLANTDVCKETTVLGLSSLW